MRTRVILVALVAVVAVVSTLLIAYNQPGATQESAQWVGSWATAPHAAARTGLSQDGFENQTIRMSIRASVGGTAARIRLSNVFGLKPLVIGDVTIGLPVAKDGAEVRPETLHDVTFGGRRSVTVQKGAERLSDEIPMTVPALATLIVSIWLPIATGPTTFHTVSRATSYLSKGNHTADGIAATYSPISIPNPIPGKTDSPWFFLSGLDVRSAKAHGSVVVFGDSISDGFQSTLRADHRWPDRLAERLAKLPADRHAPGVLNQGMSGNSLGHQAPFVPQLGPNALARLHRDLIGQTGVRTAVIEIGINDLLIFNDNSGAIVGELRQVIDQAHASDIKVVVCTLMPWEGWATWTEDRDKVRLAVNDYLRSSPDIDTLVDLDALMRDPDEPDHLKRKYDSGDHVHPNDAGYLAIANAMPLDVLAPA